MFVYLSKKIAIPNNIRVQCVSCNRVDGYIACGGDDGLLKVLKLEAQSSTDTKLRGLAAASNLTMNQALDSHKGSITVVSWNERHQRLTTGDEKGLIVVWLLLKGSWYEEMINTRSKEVVRAMKWNWDGQKICIAYEQGGVIVGSVEGNRIWGKDLKNIQLTAVEWSPDGRLLLFGSASGEVVVYDTNGNFLSKLLIQCTTTGTLEDSAKVVVMDWYNGHYTFGYFEQNCPTLAICFDNGRCQFMRSELDNEPVLLDTRIHITWAQWNHNGSVIAIVGSVHDSAGKDPSNVVHFYSPFGEHLRTLKVPGKELSSCTWERGSLRLVLAIDSFIYFANIHAEYKWCYFADTVVYTFNKPSRPDKCAVFWNTKTNEKYVKYFSNVLSVASCGDLCCLTTVSDDTNTKLQQFGIILCNSIGSPIDCKYISFAPVYLAMTATHVAAATYTGFYVWHFKNIKQLATLEVTGKRKTGSEKLYHIDAVPSGAGGDILDFSRASAPTDDPVRALTLSDKMLIIGRASGILHQYSMPSLSLVRKHRLQNAPHHLTLNSDSSLLAIIETSGLMTIFNLEAKVTGSDGQESYGELLQFERKDVWNIKWAEDNPEMFAFMEKTKLHIYRGIEPEEPIVSNGYICQFKNLEVKSVFLDEVLMEPEKTTLQNVDIKEVKSLRDARHLLETSGIDDALKFIELNQHPRLWQLLAEHSLEKLNLKVAQHSFVRAKSYGGILFVKRLANLQSEDMKRAEIASYFSRFDEAEKIYLEMDRKDLAVGLRKKLGDWYRVVQLLKSTSSAGADHLLEEAYNAIGDYHADRQEWQPAIQNYVFGRNQERLSKCYYMSDNYKGLKEMTDFLPENHSLLPEIAEMFVTVGMCQEAVDAYLKCNQVQQAVDTCIRLNQWNTAIDLSKKHDIKEIDTSLVKYAEVLLQSKKTFNAVELYRKANHFLEAAKLLFQVAETEALKQMLPLRVKKLYVLSALLVEQYHEHVKHTQVPKAKKRGVETSSALAGLLEEDSRAISDTKVIDNAWRGAEAYHFYTLSQRQLYEGHMELAVRTALRLREYDDIIDPIRIYSLLGLVAASVHAFSILSKALSKLESIPTLSQEQKKQYEELALEIFTKNSPKDSRVNKVDCLSCGAAIPDTCTSCPECETKFPVCIVSGRSIFINQFWMCPTCKHRAYEKEIVNRRNCPLCHTNIQ